ncbi:hypothetical protein [Methylobacterium sp. WL93]|uniref:hypothetical protein n=1 Tax=Methylobacterium sp. WL93 TaxID=2603892 RepID=UPI001FEEDB41|nr:hypothetical protein [Methylobacterium sp. WL93]
MSRRQNRASARTSTPAPRREAARSRSTIAIPLLGGVLLLGTSGLAEAQVLRGALDTVTTAVNSTAGSLATVDATLGGGNLATVGATVGGGSVANVGATVGGGSVADVGATVGGGTVANVGATVGGGSFATVGATVGGGTVANVGATVGGGTVANVGATVGGGTIGSVGVSVGGGTGTTAGTGTGTGTTGGTACNPCTGGGAGHGGGGGSTVYDPARIAAIELRLSNAENLPIRGNNVSQFPLPVAGGADALAAGYGATAGGVSATALGTEANAAGDGSIAIGRSASATQANTIAIGPGAQTTRTNQVAIGNGSNTYTLGGITSAQSAAAQNGATQFVTTDAAGNLATSGYGPSTIAGLGSRLDSAEGRIGGVESRVGALESRTNALSQYTTETRREARQGVATALAMPTASMPSAPGRTTWVLNSATYRGEWAGGAALSHRLPTAVPLAINVGYAYGGDGGHGVRAGLGGEF